MKTARDPNRQPGRGDSSGFTIVEFAIASIVLVVGIMGFIGAIITSQVMARATREANTASNAVITAIEEFRRDCAADFEATMTRYVGLSTLPTNPELDRIRAVVTVTVIRDEPALTPPLDLNGDGDLLDTGVAVDELRAGVLRLRVNWTGVLGARSFEHTTILARGQL